MLSEKMYALGSNRSTIRELFEFGSKLKKEIGEENVFDFSLGNPTVPTPQCVKDAIIEVLENDPSAHSYTSAQGDIATRTALADFLNKTHGANLHADNFYITCGAAASLVITLKSILQSKEDEVVIIAPFFPEYTVFIDSCGGTPVIVEPDTANFQIRFDLLEKAINKNTKGIIVNSPNNPSGAVYTKETIIKLSELLEKKNKEFNSQIFLICDEPYREIVYDDVEVPYIPKFYNNTIVCYSYSKSLSLPGERIGYILVPDEVHDSRKVYLTCLGSGRALGYVCAPSLFQKVLVKCMGQTGDINIYKENRDILYKGLTDIGFECFKPDGAFYLLLKTIGNSRDFSEKAKEFNLLLVDAKDFHCEGFVRISYCVSKEKIEKSLGAFKKLYDSYQ